METSIFNSIFPPYPAMWRQRLINHCRLFVYLFITTLALSGCTKKSEGSSSGDYYFSAKLNGVKKDFFTVKFQGDGNDNRWEHIVVGGYESPLTGTNGKLSASFDFEIWLSGGNIGPGSYSTAALPNMISRYFVPKDNGQVGYNTLNGKDLFTVKIDAISKDGIKGTFNGTLRNSAGEAISVTDGSFNLPYDQLVNP